MKPSWRYCSVVLLLLATIAAYSSTQRRRPDFLAQPLDTIGSRIEGWNQVGTQILTPRLLGRLQPTSYISRTYQKGDMNLGLFVAFYAEQRAGESMHSPKHCLPGSGWEIWKLGSAQIPVEGRTVKVNQYSIQNSGQRMIVFYWYQSKERIIASEYLGKILLVRDALLDGHTAASIVRITLPDRPAAAQEGVVFSSRIIAQLQRCFGT